MRILLRSIFFMGTTLASLSSLEASDPGAELFARAEREILLGQQNKAIKELERVVRQHRGSPLAPQAQLKIAELYAGNRQQADAFEAAQKLIEDFPASDLFSEALELQFAVVERVMEDYRKRRLKGDKSQRDLPKRASAREMLQTMLESGRYAPYAPLVHYRLAVTYDEDDQPGDAIREFNLFIDNYPGHPLADDAAFQAAFIDYRTAREPNHERGSRERAWIAFEDFLQRYPESEKAPEARHFLATLRNWEAEKSAASRRFYDRAGRAGTARITSGAPLENDPAASTAEAIKKRLDQVSGSAAR